MNLVTIINRRKSVVKHLPINRRQAFEKKYRLKRETCAEPLGAEHPQPRRSHASFFQGRDNDRVNRIRSRTYNSYLQPSSHPALESRRDQRACNFNKTASVEANNGTLDYESDVVSYVADRDDPRREEQTEICERQGQRQHDYYNLATRKNSAADRYTSEIKVKSPSLASSTDCSRRPIRCPRLDCSVNVAFSALTHHFLFDHPEVPILSVEPGAESTLIVSYGALSCNSSRCLALLLVSGKLSLVCYCRINITKVVHSVYIFPKTNDLFK